MKIAVFLNAHINNTKSFLRLLIKFRFIIRVLDFLINNYNLPIPLEIGSYETGKKLLRIKKQSFGF